MTRKQAKKLDRPGMDRMGRTPLHYAAAEGNLQDVTRILLDGADVNAKDDDGRSPLHFATQANSAPVAQLLLSAGAEIDAIDANGNSPLSNAVFHSAGSGELIFLLRGAGADPYKQNNYEVSPLDLAREISNFDVAQFFSDCP